MNPKDAKKADPHAIFLEACAFDLACQTLHENIPEERKADRRTVIGTNAALTLELFLKCLCVLEHGSYVDGHRLKKLFDLLPRQTKASLEKQWKKSVEKFDWFQRLKAAGFGNLQAVLEVGDETFVKFRYSFEPAKERTCWALGWLIPAVKQRILRLRPQWEEK